MSNPTACLWCNRPFEPHRGGSRQTFCGAACRAAYHRATRQWCEREIAEGRLSVESLRKAAAYTLPSGAKALLSGASEMGQPNSALIEPMASFRIEVSLYAIEMLVGSGWLDGDQQDDLFAIIAALKRLGRTPSVLRLA
jgi:hypothetical protein